MLHIKHIVVICNICNIGVYFVCYLYMKRRDCRMVCKLLKMCIVSMIVLCRLYN